MVDVTAAMAGWTLGWWVFDGTTVGPLWSLTTGAGMVAFAFFATLASFSFGGLYRSPVNGMRSGALFRVLRAMAAAVIVLVFWQGVVQVVALELALGSGAIALGLVILARFGFDMWLIGRRERGEFRTRVVVAGTANDTTSMVGFLAVNPEAGFRPTAMVGERPILADDSIDVAWFGDLDHAEDAVGLTNAEGVLLCVNGLPSDVVNELIHRLSRAGVRVHLSSGLGGVACARVRTIPVAHEPIVSLRPHRHSSLEAIAKRMIDVALASCLLMLMAPVMAIAAVLIKVHDGGPVLFRQIRIGRNGAPFTVLKLRSMEIDAEARLSSLRGANERQGPLFKVSSDPRVTPIGRFLRSTAIDELPQLINVLAGTMSIVGPRPALPAETAEFDGELQRRHLVRPGVTGLWQVEANHKSSFEEYRRLDLFYVDNWSVGLDLAIIVDTVPVLSRRALRALRRPAPSAPAPVISSPQIPAPVEVGS